MVKGFRSSCWGTKAMEMGGTNLANVNFASIRNQIKIIDTLKYYQTTLAGLTSTADEKESIAIKNVLTDFLTDHNYFGKIWPSIGYDEKEKLLDIIASGKGIMPYEKVMNMSSLLETPENDFYKHTEFFSALKQQNVTKTEYENCRYLFKTLKMRNLGDLNDLYNMQDRMLFYYAN